MKHLRTITISPLAAMLIACGGGGSSDTGTATAFPVDAAYTKVMTTANSFNATATDGADTYTMNLSIAPAADEAFEGVTRKKASQSLTIKKNGATAVAVSYDQYFSVSPFVSRGAKYSDGTYGVASGSGTLSTSAKIGDSGPFENITLYTNSTKSTVVSSSASTWDLEAADNASTAYACVNSIVRNSAAVITGTATGCFKIDSAGNTLGVKYTLAVSGKTLNFR